MNEQQNLRDLAFLRELDDSEFEQISNIIQLRSVDRHSQLFLQGDPARGFFVLRSGRIRLYRASPDGREFTLHQVMPGQMFAEAAIARGDTYPANAVAEEASEVVFVPRKEFLELITKHPQISIKIIASLSAWLREFAEKLASLSLMDVPQRLAEYFVKLSAVNRTDEFDLPISKSQLASELGTISETLSRNLRKLKESGAITVKGNRIRILDLELLSQIASGAKL